MVMRRIATHPEMFAHQPQVAEHLFLMMDRFRLYILEKEDESSVGYTAFMIRKGFGVELFTSNLKRGGVTDERQLFKSLSGVLAEYLRSAEFQGNGDVPS